MILLSSSSSLMKSIICEEVVFRLRSIHKNHNILTNALACYVNHVGGQEISVGARSDVEE